MRAVPQETEATPEQAEQSFRDMLKDVVDFIRAVEPYCATFEEMINLAEFAQKNDAQVRLLIEVVCTKPQQR